MSDDKQRRYSLFPKTLANCIEPITRPLFKAQGSSANRLIINWNKVAGPQLAAHTRVEKLAFAPGKKNGGTLTISVENGFATELQYMQPVILERLADYFGYRAITRIAISHTFQHAVPLAQATSRPPALPRECRETAQNASDNELKQALQSLAKTLSTPHV